MEPADRVWKRVCRFSALRVLACFGLGAAVQTSEGFVKLSCNSRLFGRIGVILSLTLAASALLGGAGPARAEIGTYILVDAQTGAVLDEKDATRQWYPASLTKMMTAYVTFKALREGRASLTSPVVQSQNSISEPPSKMGFKVGTRFTVDTALKILLVKSANDVAVALAEAIGGTEEGFITLMNTEAARLGMRDTYYVNPHGLPDNRQVTSARDLAILAKALRDDFPEARNYYNHPGLKFGKKALRSANREFLLRVPGADGMKTGYICNSGYNVAASVTRNGRTVIAIVLGAASGLERIAFSRELLDKGFQTRSARYTIDNLPHRGGTPPQDNYCKRNEKPDADQLLARYDMTSAKQPVMAYASSNRDPGAVIIGGIHNAADDNDVEDEGGVQTGNGKVDWAKVMDKIIGPRRIAYEPIVVSLGTPDGPARDPVALALVPLPSPNPARGNAFVAAESVAAASGDSTNSPGQIFRKGIGFSVPVPASSPGR